MGYRVKSVSAMTGIPRGTLLAWERRHEILELQRSPAGYREYSDADVALLRRLKALVDAGYSIGEAVDLVKAPPGGVDPIQAMAGPEAAPRRDPGLPVEVAGGGTLLDALLDFDRAAAERLIPLLGQVPFARVIDDLFVPMLDDLGAAWARGEITIAQEHFVSGFAREHLLAMYHGLGGGPEWGTLIACATPPGELHELGLLVVALKLALAGNRVVWLGANLPVSDLCAYLTSHRPRVVCVSFTQAVSRDVAVAFAGAVRAGAPSDTVIVLGGPGVARYAGPVMEGVVILASFADLERKLARLGTRDREPRVPA